MIASEFEIAAMNGFDVPRYATDDEKIEFLFFKALYAEHRKGNMSRKECGDLKIDFLFKRKCWENAGERYNKTNYAILQYQQNKTVENADKIVEAFSGLHEIKEEENDV